MEFFTAICVVISIILILCLRFLLLRNADLEKATHELQNTISELEKELHFHQSELENLKQNVSDQNKTLLEQNEAITSQQKTNDILNAYLQTIFIRVNNGLDQYSVEELSHIPKGVTFDDNLYPHFYDNTVIEKDFAVYVNPHDKYYHRKPGCCNAYNKIHLYKGIQQYLPCPVCVEDFVSDYKIPSWYYTFTLWKHLEKAPEITDEFERTAHFTQNNSNNTFSVEDGFSNLQTSAETTPTVTHRFFFQKKFVVLLLGILGITMILFFTDPFNIRDHTANITVYVTETGSKYHRLNCNSLRSSKIPISLDKAVKSYEPCERCNPPTK